MKVTKFHSTLIAAASATLLFASALPAEAMSTQDIEQLDNTVSTVVPNTGTFYTVDAATGDILSITSKPPINTRISIVGPGCSSTSVCLYPTSGVYYGFQYSGILNGSWPGRKGYFSGNWTTQLKWIYGGSTVTGQVIPPQVTVLFSTSNLTVTQVRIY